MSCEVLDARSGLVAFEPHQFQQADLRNRVTIAAAGDDQRRDDRQRQRNLDLDGRAAPELALNVDRAADLFDVGLHDVHADAAAGDVGDLLGSGKAGQEDQLSQLRDRSSGRLVRRSPGLVRRPCA